MAASQAREYIDAGVAEVANWPGVTITHEHRSKHIAAVLTFEGRTRRAYLPATPGGDQHRCVLNHICWLKNVLRSLGAERIERRRAETKPIRRPTTPALPKFPRRVEAHPSRPDRWLAPLAALKQQLETA